MAVYDDEKTHDEGLIPDDDVKLSPEEKDSFDDLERRYNNSEADDMEKRLGSSDSKSDSPEELANKEKGGSKKGGGEAAAALSAGGLAAAEAGESGSLFNDKDDSKGSNLQRAGDFVKRNKKGIGLGVGAGGGLIGLIILGIAALLPFELVNIEKNLLKYETKIEVKIEKKASNKIAAKIVCRAFGTCAKDEADEPLAKNLDDFKFNDPDVQDALAKQGINVETGADGTVTGLTDTETGQPITANDIENNDLLFERFSEALPEWSVGQEESFRSVMVDHANATFDVVPDNPDENADQDVVDGVVSGANPTEEALAQAEATNASEAEVTPTPQNPNPVTPAEQGTIAGNNELSSDITQGLAAGESEATILSKLQDKITGKFSDPAFIGLLVTDACSIKQTADKARAQRKPAIMKLLVRHMSVMLSLADQIKTGHISSKTVGQVMSIYNGDPSVPKTTTKVDSNGNQTQQVNEASLPFSSSASWFRITGHADSIDTNQSDPNYTPEIEKSALPINNSGDTVVHDVDQLVGLVGGGVICTIVNSPFGFIANGILGVVSLVGDFNPAALAGGLVAVQAFQFLIQKIAADIVKYFTPVGLFGLENSAQWMNNADAGTNIGFNDYARRMGGNPINTSTANNQYQVASAEQNAEFAALPWRTRVFSIDNPSSLISRLALDLPMSRSQAFFGFTNFLANLPHALVADFSTILMPHKVLADATTQNPGQPYGLIQYSFTDSDLEPYDVTANEQYLREGKITAGMCQDSNPSVCTSFTNTRIDLLGDPTTYIDNPSGDSNKNDLLHCYVDPFTEFVNGSNDKYCGDVGTFDYANTCGNSTDPACVFKAPNISAIYYQRFEDLHPGWFTVSVSPVDPIDVTHFRQYILDWHTMVDYTNLMSTSGK